MSTRWLRKLKSFCHLGTAATSRKAARKRPRLEVLEDRSVPSHTPLPAAQPNNEELRRFRAEAATLLMITDTNGKHQGSEK